MIIDKELKILLTKGNIQYYKIYSEYENNKIGDMIIVPIDKITRANKIKVKCDICGFEKSIKYYDYLNQTKNNIKIYTCKKCYSIKIIQTCIEKYGVNNIFQLEEIKEKIKKHNIDTYGCESHNSSEIVKQNKIKANQLKYGVDNVFQLEEIKEKSKETMMEKYGVEYNMQIDFCIENRKKTYLKHYGVDNPTKCVEILEKSLKSNLTTKIYKNTNLYYQASYELDFLEHCEIFGIINDITKPTYMINYIFEGKNRKYLPDYILDKNIIIEIKGSYWYKKFKSIVDIKKSTCEKLGYKYFLIVDKNYNEFEAFLKLKEIL